MLSTFPSFYGVWSLWQRVQVPLVYPVLCQAPSGQLQSSVRGFNGATHIWMHLAEPLVPEANFTEVHIITEQSVK
jgi:hypothetical protein